MAANEGACFQRDLLEVVAKTSQEMDFKVSSMVEELPEGPSFTVSLRIEDLNGDPLLDDLHNYSARFETDAALELMITLPGDFPFAPPIIRLLHPVLVPGTGGVLNGNFVLPELLPEGWDPDMAIATILPLLKDSLISKGARIDTSAFAIYNFQAFKASRQFLLNRPTREVDHPSPFSHTYYVYSSAFALETMGLDLPEGFDAGNKILMPSASLHALTQSNEASPAGDESDDLQSLLRSWIGADDSQGISDGGAFTFQLVSALRFPVYVGVREFTCPHADAIIVPQQVLANMFVPEGSEVQLSRVKLPKVHSLVLQPHTTNFGAVEAFSGKEPREFLEASLHRYSCLQAGDVIVCDGGGSGTDASIAGVENASFRFNVVCVRPEGAQAAALWADFATHVPIDLLPPMDEYIVPAKRPAAAGVPEGLAHDVGLLRPELAGQVFGESVPGGAGGVPPSGSDWPPSTGFPTAATRPGASSGGVAITAPVSLPTRPTEAAVTKLPGEGASTTSGVYIPPHNPVSAPPPTAAETTSVAIGPPVDMAAQRRLAAEAARRRALAAPAQAAPDTDSKEGR